MRRTRALYHYAVRRVKRDQKNVTRQRFVDAVLSNSNRDFWSEVKRMNGNKVGCANVVDNKTNITRNAWQSLAYSPIGAIVSPPSEYL